MYDLIIIVIAQLLGHGSHDLVKSVTRQRRAVFIVENCMAKLGNASNSGHSTCNPSITGSWEFPTVLALKSRVALGSAFLLFN